MMTGQDHKPMPEFRELTPDELNQVSGGPIYFPKNTDGASPQALVIPAHALVIPA